MDSALGLAENPPSQLARDHVGIYLDAAATLGRRTAELHMALAIADRRSGVRARTARRADDLQALSSGRSSSTPSAILDLLKDRLPYLPDEVIEIAAAVLSRRRRNSAAVASAGHARTFGAAHPNSWRLPPGPGLRVKTDFVILDFEGEPARPLGDRRAKQMSAEGRRWHAALLQLRGIREPDWLHRAASRRLCQSRALGPALGALGLRGIPARLIGKQPASAAFVPASARGISRASGHRFCWKKRFMRCVYELNSRPEWLRIPLMGILSMSL